MTTYRLYRIDKQEIPDGDGTYTATREVRTDLIVEEEGGPARYWAVTEDGSDREVLTFVEVCDE